MWRANGVNLPEMALYQALGSNIVLPTSFGVCGTVRYLSHMPTNLPRPSEVVFDFDDVVLLHGKVNPYAVALLSVLAVVGVRTRIISRHDGDLWSAIRAMGIGPLVSEVNHIGKEEKKSAYMQCHCWMVDDSFKEREDGLSIEGVRAFDASAIPMLLAAVCSPRFGTSRAQG
jgi:hypothetical protein